jgi:hypothetical protein
MKADVSVAGDGWTDSRIAEALDTNRPAIERTRHNLVEGGIDAVLTRKHDPKGFWGGLLTTAIGRAGEPATAPYIFTRDLYGLGWGDRGMS